MRALRRFALLECANSTAFRERKTGRRGEIFARFWRNLKNLAKKRLARGVAATQTAYNNKDGVSLFRRRNPSDDRIGNDEETRSPLLHCATLIWDVGSV